MIISFGPFFGMMPKIAPHLLPQNAAQQALNCQLERGLLESFFNAPVEATPAKVGVKQSIHLFAGAFWFHWLTPVSVVRGAVAGDTHERTFFTGDGPPQVTDATIATSGGDLYPMNSWMLGLPAPISPPMPEPVTQTGSITGITQANPAVITSDDHGLLTGHRVRLTVTGMTELNLWEGPITRLDANQFSIAEDSSGYGVFTGGSWLRTYADSAVAERMYVCTYVTAAGEEGPPSGPSPVVTVGDGQTVNLTMIPGPPAGNYNVNRVRFYRTSSGQFLFVGEVAAGNTTAVDAVSELALGEALPSRGWIAPPEDLHGTIALPNGGMAGISGNQVCMCVPYQYHAWPITNRRAFNDPPQALAAFGSSLLVATTGEPHVMTGQDPASMYSEKLELAYPCIGPRGMADLGYAALYPSTEGLVMVGVGVARLATEEIWTKEQWMSYNPSTLYGIGHNGKYFGFYDTGTEQAGFIFDPQRKDLVKLNMYATAGYSDPASGNLYLMVDDDIVVWNAGTIRLTKTWISPPREAPRPVNPGVAKVKCDTFPVTFSLYADEVLVHIRTVTNNAPFRLPGGYLAERFTVVISGTGTVRQVHVAETMDDIKAVA